MNQAMTSPDLSQLRDIHLPAPVSWWPPAIGWWLLPGIILLAVIGGWLLYRRHRHSAWRRSALAKLARLRSHYQAQPSTSQAVVSELSVLLRRVAISRFPREEAAKLSGESWLAFLDRGKISGTGFQSAEGRLLLTAPYAQQMNIAPAQLHQLFALCEGWVRQLPTRGKS